MTEIMESPALVSNVDAVSLFEILNRLETNKHSEDTSTDDFSTFRRLSEYESLNLYRNHGLIRKLVNTYPDECKSIGYQLIDNKGNIVEENNTLLINAVYEALIYSRIYSRCYILLEFSSDEKKPVKLGENMIGYKIHHDISRFGDYFDIENRKIHYTRIIEVFCNKTFNKFILDDKNDINYADSYIQQIFNSFSNFKKNNSYVNYILENLSYLTLGIDNFNNMQKNDQQKQNIWQKLFNFNYNRKINRLLTYDRKTEQLEFINQTFSGAKEAIEVSKEFLLSECDYPPEIIFETSQSQRLGSGVQNQLVARYLWARRATRWIENNVAQYYRIYYERTQSNKNLKLEIPFIVDMTDDEKAELELKASQRNKNLVGAGVISVNEARTGYKGNEFTLNIELEENPDLNVKSLDVDEQKDSPASENMDSENIPSDSFFDEIANISSEYLSDLGDEILE